MNAIETCEPQSELPPTQSAVRMERPIVYYDVGRKDYWILNNRKDWISVNETALKRLLRGAGFSAKQKDGERLSDLDECLTKIQLCFDVAYAGPLAGCKTGLFEEGGQRILVTNSPKLAEPKRGDFPILQQFLDTLLEREEIPYVKGWLKIAYESLRAGHCRPGQLLVLAGERNSGKSLFQKVITEILGGRAGKPYRYMSGGTDFNGELFGVEHLIIEDEVASTDIRARRHFGARIKDFTVNEIQSCHAKNRQAIQLRPFWRVSLSLNEEPENLMILPPMDESLADKIILLRTLKAKLPPTFSPEERERFWQALVAEIPAFLWDLTHWEIPRELRCERFGIKHFHDPELLQALHELTPEAKLLALIDAAFNEGPLDPNGFEGTAEKLQGLLLTSPLHSHEAKRLLDWPSAAGTYLGRLVQKCPDRVNRTRTANERTWRVTPPISNDAVMDCFSLPTDRGNSPFQVEGPKPELMTP
jgi:hypothetical protein